VNELQVGDWPLDSGCIIRQRKESAMRTFPNVLTILAALFLTLGFVGCGNQEPKRETPAEKTAAEKVREALAAQHAAEEQHRAEVNAAALAGKLASINTICPVTGLPVDPAIAPVVVEVMIFNPHEFIAIGVANAAAAESVRQNPDRYTPAARHNREARSSTTVGP
jgi:hypothetical protein